MTFDQAASVLAGLYEEALTDKVDVMRDTPGADDDFGNPVESFAVSSTPDAWVKPGSVDENREDQSSPFRTKTVLVAAAADVLDSDRIRYPISTGRVYHIVAVETINAGAVTARKRVTIEVAD